RRRRRPRAHVVGDKSRCLSCLSLKGWGVLKDVLSWFDLSVDSPEPTPVSRGSARSAAGTNDLDDRAGRFSACSVGVEAGEHRLAMWLWCNVSTVDAYGLGQGRNLGCGHPFAPRNG